jgi:hypothetical protein
MNAKLLAPIVIAIFTVVLFVACQFFGLMGIAVAFALLLGVVLMPKARTVLVLFWLTTLLTDTVGLFAGDVLTKVVEQLFGFYLLFILSTQVLVFRRVLPGTAVVNVAVLILAGIIGASTVANRVPPLPVLFFTLTYLKHLLVFYFTLTCCREEDSRSVLKLMAWSFGIQVVVNLAYYVGLNPLPGMLGRGMVDGALGTLGSAHYVGYYMIACAYLLLALVKRTSQPHTRMLLIGCMAVVLVQFYLTFTMHAYPLLAAGLMLQQILFTRRPLMRVARMLLAGSMFVFIVAAFMSLFGWMPVQTEDVLSASTWSRRWHQMEEGYKGQAYTHVFLHANVYLQRPLLGGGPGNYTSATAQMLGRPLSALPHLAGPYFMGTSRVKDLTAHGSVVYSPTSGFIALWGDLGPFGFLVYWGLHVYAALRIWRQSRRGLYRDTWRAALAEAFVPTCIIFLGINGIMDAVPIKHLTLGLWIWAAVVWAPSSNPDEGSAQPRTVS